MSEEKTETKTETTKTLKRRTIPTSDLDFNMLTTNPEWGDLYNLMDFFSRDLRLANLSTKDGEMAYVQYYIDLASLILYCDPVKVEAFSEPFRISLSLAASRLELSHSKAGFFRKIMNTFFQETRHTEVEPPKKSLFNKNK